jgi:hypothetical protein
MNRRVLVLSLVILVGLPLITVQACGPDFSSDVFVRKMRPDNPKEFAAGKLGILLPTYPRADLIVAYRYLNGGALTPVEQAGYSPTETGRKRRARSMFLHLSIGSRNVHSTSSQTMLLNRTGSCAFSVRMEPPFLLTT